MPKSTPPFPPFPKWTQARFFSFIRSALRSASQRWPPKQEAKKLARRPYTGDNPRMKWEYLCASCGGWFADKECELNHIISVGTLTRFEDLPGFVERLFCGVDGFEVLCKECHKKLTHNKIT